MSYEQLKNYKIPLKSTASATQDFTPYSAAGLQYAAIQGAFGTYNTNSVPEVNKEYYGYGNNAYNESYTGGPEGFQQQQSSAPDKPMKYGEYKASLKRKFLDINSMRSKKPETIKEYDDDGMFVIFMGRDKNYPDALNALIHPIQCDLCNMKMNSLTSAKDHYESKSHDKSITQWLTKNYTDKGLEAPEVQRFYKQGPAGPDAFYCEFCDLKLTSLTHADQHYTGKRHRLVISQRGKPSGVGYYNNEGKWVRVSTKLVPQSKDTRFGIGDQFKYQNIVADTTTTTEISADTTTGKEDTTPKPPKISKIDEKDPTLFCAVCRVSVTSALQMTMHLSGSKHQKKLKASGIEITSTGHAAPSSSTDSSTPIAAVVVPLPDNVLNSVIKEEKPDPTDLSMYRTPSGQYYCQTCNLTITNLHALEQHLIGKRHLKSQVEQKAMAALTGRNASKSANVKKYNSLP